MTRSRSSSLVFSSHDFELREAFNLAKALRYSVCWKGVRGSLTRIA